MTGLEQAQQYFRDRGIQEKTYKRYRVEIIPQPSHDQLKGWLGTNSYYLEAAIVFPNLTVNPDTAAIEIHSYYLRCFPPPIGADGKERKFLSTLGSTYRPYILPPVIDIAYCTDQPIYIVEKQVAAQLLEQNGLHAIALDGTWGAAAKREEVQPVKLHPVLTEFDWIGRPVYLCFDGDFRSRTNVLQGLIRTYILFSVAGALVRLLQWDSALKGIDDFIAARAGLDSTKQRVELDTLTATVSELSASKAAQLWIIPQYRTLFEREIAAIVPGLAERSQLAECIHEALGTTAGDLKKSWGVSAKVAPDKDQKATPCQPIPEPWPEPLNYSDVLDGVLSEFIDPRFVVITPEQAVVCTVHTLTTYLTDYLEDWLHFLYITAGAKESGKTKLLSLFYYLCYHATICGDPSAASVYYRLRTGVHTILIDEVDKNEDRKKAVLDLINYSTSRDTAWVSRADPESKQCLDFPTFCPKILAGIGTLRGTTQSRSIIIQMLRKLPGGPRIRIKRTDKERFTQWRSQLMRIATEIGPKIAEYDIDELRLPGGLSDREADNWTLLFLVAQMVGGKWPGLLAYGFHKLCPPKNPDEAEVEDDSEDGEGLIRDLARIWIQTPTREFYLSADLLMHLRTMKDRPWVNMRNGLGMSREKFAQLLRAFGIKSVRAPRELPKRPQGYFLAKLLPLFERIAPDIWNPPPPENRSSPAPSPEPPRDVSKEDPITEKRPPLGENKKNSPTGGFNSGPTQAHPADQVLEPLGGWARVAEISSEKENSSPTQAHLSPSESTIKWGGPKWARVEPPCSPLFLNSIPPSTPQVAFCNATHPERLTCLDLETWYPYDDTYSQPATYTTLQLATRQRSGKAHPYAADPRRCAIRLLTIHDSLDTFGPTPITIDLAVTPNLPPEVLKALAESTLIGHNLDFDLTVLRRYGILVSDQLIDTMIASRLLGLGKQKLSFDPTAYADLSLDAIEGMESEIEADDPNPGAHDLAATVGRYLGIRMDKASTQLGASDWGRQNLSPEQYAYATEDVALLFNLWEAIAPELEKAKLQTVFATRMKFATHLNQIKMTGIPVDPPQLEEKDLPRATTEKEKSAEELTQKIFSELTFKLPRSRQKKVKIKNEEGKTKWIAGPTHEGFRPSSRNQHWLPALAAHGIYLEDTREPTLRRADKPECQALLQYSAAAKRLSEIVGISRSIFADGRVRAMTWNQLAAVTGRIISRKPNLQQIPNEYRGPFRVKDPWLWLAGDLEQIEMLILAVVTKDPNLLGMLREGQDVYVQYGSKIFSKKAERGPGEDQITEVLRRVAKIPTLGTSYGMTPYGFVRQIRDELGIEYSIEQAEEFFETFFEMFPAIAAYHARAQEEAGYRTEVRTIAGTRRWLPPLIGEPSDDWQLAKEYERSLQYRKNVLLNTPIQGSGADLLIWAVNQFMPQLPSPVQIINLVHDEVDALVTKETLDRTIELITKAFRDVFAKFYPESPLVPKIKFTSGPSWGETAAIP